jgi:hypothetical protein
VIVAPVSEDTPSTPPEPEQALAVFNHAGEEIRFFKSQQWHVTNYALGAYAALVAVAAAPKWGTWKAWVSIGCAGLVIAAAWHAWRVLLSLDEALQKERDRMEAARIKLPLIADIHRRHPKCIPERNEVFATLRAAIIIGAFLTILISLSRCSV